MSSHADLSYPSTAFAPDGTLWWRLKTVPGGKREYGDEPKIAAYLACHVGVGGVFTMPSLREALGEDTIPNDAEHLNRRLRNLRTRDGWVIPSGKDDGSIASHEYRVKKIGWHPGTGLPRPKNDQPSEATRRRVFDRDKSICQVCFTPAGESYPDRPDKVARLTLGHRVPGTRADRHASVDELQTECARCNEPIRDELFNPVTLVEVLPVVRNLRRGEKSTLLAWLENSRRSPSRIEELYSLARWLKPEEREALADHLRASL